MELWFMNSLCKLGVDASTQQAQVIACRQGERWSLLWKVDGQDGELASEIWYEGDCRETLQASYAVGMSEKLGLGYVPLIRPADCRTSESKQIEPARRSWLECYADYEGETPLYEQLKEWRRQRASKERKPPFVIATNRMLQMVGVYVPHTLEQLQQLPGFGESKLSLYGEEIIAAASLLPQPHPFPLDWIYNALTSEQVEEWTNKQQTIQHRKALEKITLRNRLLDYIRAGASLEQLPQQLSIPRNTLLQFIEQLADDHKQLMEVWVSTELQTMPEEQKEAALQSFLELRTDYLKPVWEQVYGTGKYRCDHKDRCYEWLRLLRLQMKWAGNASQVAIALEVPARQ